PPVVKELSATGSGDVLFACVLHALFQSKMSLTEAVAYALPFAAANAASAGVADFAMPGGQGLSAKVIRAKRSDE
ncbi:MAG TPA: hypothetical protein VKC60_07120, partial [Opitutaceae bacterium]|nr:hypothetical protein [Opitutaceae bacterium]